MRLNQLAPAIALPSTPGRSIALGPAPTAGPAIGTASSAVELSNERVWGGAVIPPEADVFRDSVAIFGNNKLCSGVVIDSQTVITAGDCYCDGVMDEIVTGTSILSTDRVRVVKEQSASFRPCEEVDRDPSGGEVALLKLERSLVTTPKPLANLQLIRYGCSATTPAPQRHPFVAEDSAGAVTPPRSGRSALATPKPPSASSIKSIS